MIKQTNNISKNIILSVSSQIVSLMVSLILSLIVPKFINEYQYAYWQTFVLYLSYVGSLHFGLLDGIVLRYSQYDYEDLDKPLIRSQFKMLFFSISTISIITILYSIIFCTGITRLIIILIAFGMITKQLTGYNSYTFQMTNRINYYAVLTIVQRASYGVLVVFLLLGKIQWFYWLCIAELVGDLIGFFSSISFNKGMYFGKSVSKLEAFNEWKLNVSSGIILMIANLSSMFIIGSAKMIVQWHWDELTFGKVSFSFSVSNLFLTFVTAISIVLFPSIKRMNQDKLPDLYRVIRGCISPILFIIMIFYYPGCWLIGKYLPNYTESLSYLGIILPIIIYTSKVGLLTNNYLKVYRKEKIMLAVNFISIIIAIIGYVFSAYILNNLYILLIWIVLATMFRSILSEIVVMKKINKNFIREFIIEGIMTLAFIIFTYLFDLHIAFIAYMIALIFYLFLNRNDLKTILNQVKSRLLKPKP